MPKIADVATFFIYFRFERITNIKLLFKKGLNRPKAVVREFELSDYIELKIIMRAN